MAPGCWRGALGPVLAIGAVVLGLLGGVSAEEHSKIPLPSYHYGAKIPVSCLERST